MKKMLTLFLLLISLPIFGQNPYNDALKISKYVVNGKLIVSDSNAVAEYCAIFNNYLKNPLPQTNYRTISNEFGMPASPNFNPFLKDFFSSDSAGAAASNKTIGSRIAGIFSSVGGLNVTNFADGLAKFLVKRFKEELSISFFAKFKKDLDDKKYEELRTLFPQTHKVFKVIDNEIYNFSKYLNSLREAFIKDLGNLYVGLKKVKDLPKYQKYLDDRPVLKTIVLNAFYFIDQFANGTHPGDVIANYKEETLIDLPDSSANLESNLRSAVKTLKLFSASFRSMSIENYWVTADSIKILLAKQVERGLYFGLIYQKSIGIIFQTKNGPATLQKLLGDAKAAEAGLLKYQEHIENIADRAQEVNEYIKAIKEKLKSEIDYNDYYKLYNAALDILNEGLNILGLPDVNIETARLDEIKAKIAQWIEVARTAGEIYIDIRTKNYSSAIVNTVSILDTIFQQFVQSELREKILKYGGFIAVVAEAENSDEVEAAIEAVALPVGSSRIKRECAVNIGLNAYVGGFAGGECMPVLKERKNSFVFGLTAPVGVAFSFGNKGKGKLGDKGGKSISIFVSAIDIGALATFRMNDDSSEVASEIKLKNIVSPGISLFYGFGKCPISLGAGIQLGPQLRQVTATDIDVNKNYYLRYGITLAVDIPLLNFYTRTK